VNRRPVNDMDVPSLPEMKEILDDIDAAIAAGRAVYVHCWGGLGRTGTVVGCWLARHGIARGKSALKKLRELRGGAANAVHDSPQTATQKVMVMKWRKGA
jgi:protein-tyrosine phosphatase